MPAAVPLSPEVPLGDREVVGGVDTHKDTHTAAVIDVAGRMLGHETFPATGAGYARLLEWLSGFGRLLLVGIEGTGVYGSGLAAHLRVHGVGMVEVDRPDRKARRWQGRSDPVDAEAAARAALADRALPPALGPPHPRLRRTPHHRRPAQERDHPLPQAPDHPRDPLRPHPRKDH